ncbi:MAG: hypothetical protein Q7U20_02765 [Caulobacter sp.]|nr:hypothetical protein [Caulobacter sp.]
MDDTTLLEGFEAGTLAEFHHRDHIRIAWLCLRRDGVDAGSVRVKAGLQALAAAHGASAKYNETLTQFWIRQVAASVSADAFQTFEAFVEANPHMLDKRYALQFYRAETLAGPQARTGWIEPDLWPQSGSADPEARADHASSAATMERQ